MRVTRSRLEPERIEHDDVVALFATLEADPSRDAIDWGILRHEGRRLAVRAAERLLDESPDALSILYDVSGRPQLRIAGAPSAVDVSISHRGHVVAGAAARGMKIGVDVEPCRDILPHSWRYFLTTDEISACAASPRRALWAWTVKEAFYKALDARRPFDFKRIEVRGWDDALEVAWPDAGPAARSSSVLVRERDGVVVTLVTV